MASILSIGLWIGYYAGMVALHNPDTACRVAFGRAYRELA